MTRLLVVTDNTFYRQGEAVFDRFGFDRAFFDDYAAVFEEVRVAARIDRMSRIDGMHRADGAGVSFVDLANEHGPGWMLAPWWRHCRPLADALVWADAVCVRIPSAAGWHAARLARSQGKPLMFELLGDPLAGGAGSAAQRIGGMVQYWRTRRIVRWSRVGSYVTRAHLQRRYPAAGALTASISSIRLPEGAFRPPRTAPASTDRLRLVSVGSLLPVKNHAALLNAVALVRQRGLDASLTLVGDGALRAAIEAQIARLGLGAQVRLTGHLAGWAKVEAALDAADLFVMPSWSEGMPRALIEAMARGLPAIGSAVGGIRELLPPELLFDPRRAAEIAQLIEGLGHPDRYRRAARSCAKIPRDFAPGKLSAARRALLAALRAHAPKTPRASSPSPKKPRPRGGRRQGRRSEPKGEPICGRASWITWSAIDLLSHSSWCRSKNARSISIRSGVQDWKPPGSIRIARAAGSRLAFFVIGGRVYGSRSARVCRSSCRTKPPLMAKSCAITATPFRGLAKASMPPLTSRPRASDWCSSPTPPSARLRRQRSLVELVGRRTAGVFSQRDRRR